MLVCLLHGFSSGLPFWLTGLVQAWLRQSGVSLSSIGLFSLAGLPYTWKFLWAPLCDRYAFGGLGRRRSWSLATQVALLFLIAAFGFMSPANGLVGIATLAVAVGFVSATQDVAVDAQRRELLSDNELGLGSSLYANGYRAANFVPGSLALVLADHHSWRIVYLTVAAFMAVGLLGTWVAPEPATPDARPTTLKQALVGPFREFFKRSDLSRAVGVLALLLLYKFGDSMATSLVTPFYLDVGFTMTQIGTIAKVFGFAATMVGLIVGGLVLVKIGINRALWVFGLVQICSIFGFVVLASAGPDVNVLAPVVVFEYLGVGLGTSALLAFAARETNKGFTATQFALLSSVAVLPRSVASAFAGFLVEAVGYGAFFWGCVLAAVPGLLVLTRVAPWSGAPAERPASN